MKPAPSKPETLAKINALLDDLAFTDRCSDLYCRWRDEKEYEDFSQYADAMKKLLPEGMEFLSGTKRPFGFKFKVDGNTYHITMRSRDIGWKRIA